MLRLHTSSSAMDDFETEEEDAQSRMRAVVAKDVFPGVPSDSFRPRKHKDELCRGRTGLDVRQQFTSGAFFSKKLILLT